MILVMVEVERSPDGGVSKTVVPDDPPRNSVTIISPVELMFVDVISLRGFPVVDVMLLEVSPLLITDHVI